MRRAGKNFVSDPEVPAIMLGAAAAFLLRADTKAPGFRVAGTADADAVLARCEITDGESLSSPLAMGTCGRRVVCEPRPGLMEALNRGFCSRERRLQGPRTTEEASKQVILRDVRFLLEGGRPLGHIAQDRPPVAGA
jgi:hypothetical protein